VRICVWARKGGEVRCSSCGLPAPSGSDLAAETFECQAHTPEAARAAGVTFYELPSELDLEAVDPLIRRAVATINNSGWVYTAESCQGHPDSTQPQWADNTDPMLRLVCRAEDEGRLWSALLQACRSMEVRPDDEEGVTLWGRPGTTPLKVYVDNRGRPDWCETLVYVPASTAYYRDRGIETFERFGRLIEEEEA